MPKAKRHPDRRTVVELIDDLREEATDLAPDLDGIPAQETTYGEAAQTLEEFEAALSQIAGGADDPKAVATHALILSAPLKPLSGSADEDPLRRLLKPRRT